MATGRGNTASASMTNGAYVFLGARLKPGTSKLSITIEEEPMTIKREDVDRRKVDFSDVATGKRLPPVHPGKILRDELLRPLGLSVYELANAIKVPRSRANDIVRGHRAITTDTALRLARYFGMTAEFWINLQAHYDLDVADRSMRKKIEREVEPRAA